MQFGLWLCPTDLDNEIRRQAGSSITPPTPAATIPDAPTSLAASLVPATSIDLTWDPVDNATSYEIFRSTTGDSGPYSFISDSSGLTSYSDTFSLVAATTYWHKVSAYNDVGDSYGSEESPWTSNVGFSNRTVTVFT
jgi:hypothetical protein